MLSGLEIKKAVERYQLIQHKIEEYAIWQEGLPGRMLVGGKLENLEPTINIENFDPTPSHEGGRLNPNSYNLTLANKLLVYENTCYAPPPPGTVMSNGYMQINSHEPKPVKDDQQRVLDSRQDNPTIELTIPPEGLILRPGILYLGSTQEWTESYNCVPVIEGRSSIARLGMSVHITAGFGDVGFRGRWTTEMTVVHPLRIYPDMQICQIAFDTIGEHFPYQSKKYQDQQGVVASQLYRDFDQKKGSTSESGQK